MRIFVPFHPAGSPLVRRLGRTVPAAALLVTGLGALPAGAIPAVALPAGAAPPRTSFSAPAAVRGTTWYLRDALSSGVATTTLRYGATGDIPVLGDWNGDGTVSVGVFRRGTWYLRNRNSSGTGELTVRLGQAGDIPVVGDWNGDGIDTPGVVHGNSWYVLAANSSTAPVLRFGYGSPGDRPVAGDWNGDGIDTPGVVRGNAWYLRNSTTSGNADVAFRYGSTGDIAVAGDWNGDGIDAAGVVRGNRWYLRNSNTSGVADAQFTYGTPGDRFLTWGRVRTAVPAGLAGTHRTVVPTGHPVVALTFDAGGDNAGIAKVLATLNATSATGTFFVTGKWIQAYPADTAAIGLRYPIGNHTYSHPHLPGLSDSAVRAEIDSTTRAIYGATGQSSQPLFRFPYGEYDSRTLSIVNSMSHASYYWTVDTLGWKGAAGGQSVDSIVARVLAGLRPGEIVLMHVGASTDGSTLDADALPKMIAELRARGYGFITLRMNG